jgi:hypothetical protein
VVRRAYADWSNFDEDRRMLTRSHVELIEMPQRMGVVRKNAADIKLAVDAVELADASHFYEVWPRIRLAWSPNWRIGPIGPTSMKTTSSSATAVCPAGQ